ncbi:MAG: hypothetical protein ACT4QF_19625 [Sporichthyaceae bacterium]
MRTIAILGGAVTAVALAATGAGAAITPPSAGLPAGINLVVCSDGGSTTYVVDGPVFRTGVLAAGECRGLTVQPGVYTAAMQGKAAEDSKSSVSVTRPGGARAFYAHRTSVTTGVDAVPTNPTLGPKDANGYPTGINSADSGPGINVTAVVFQHLGRSHGGSSGTGQYVTPVPSGGGGNASCPPEHASLGHC